jgi:hypothetical protein
MYSPPLLCRIGSAIAFADAVILALLGARLDEPGWVLTVPVGVACSLLCLCAAVPLRRWLAPDAWTAAGPVGRIERLVTVATGALLNIVAAIVLAAVAPRFGLLPFASAYLTAASITLTGAVVVVGAYDVAQVLAQASRDGAASRVAGSARARRPLR